MWWHWHELDEAENECISHHFSFFAIFLSKIIKIGENLTKFWQNNFAQFFWDTVYIKHRLRKCSVFHQAQCFVELMQWSVNTMNSENQTEILRLVTTRKEHRMTMVMSVLHTVHPDLMSATRWAQRSQKRVWPQGTNAKLSHGDTRHTSQQGGSDCDCAVCYGCWVPCGAGGRGSHRRMVALIAIIAWCGDWINFGVTRIYLWLPCRNIRKRKPKYN